MRSWRGGIECDAYTLLMLVHGLIGRYGSGLRIGVWEATAYVRDLIVYT